jgi:hypothetical protein
MSDLVGKVERRARKPWITQEMISKIYERRKWKNVNSHRIIEFQRTGHYDLMYMKTKEVGWKENHGIQNIGIEDSQRNMITDQRRVLLIWENCSTEP